MRIRQGSSSKRGLTHFVLALVLALPALSACKVVPIAADRAARERLAAAFEADRYVDAIWATQATPYWDKNKVPLANVAAAIDRDPDQAAERFGHRPGEGAAPVYVVAGEGRVSALSEGRARKIKVLVEPTGGVARTIDLQVGPVVSGTALRDSLPFVTFNDFANQIDFAEVGSALTKRAVSASAPAARDLKVGDRVRFVAALPVGENPETLVATPLSLERLGVGL